MVARPSQAPSYHHSGLSAQQPVSRRNLPEIVSRLVRSGALVAAALWIKEAVEPALAVLIEPLASLRPAPQEYDMPVAHSKRSTEGLRSSKRYQVIIPVTASWTPQAIRCLDVMKLNSPPA